MWWAFKLLANNTGPNDSFYSLPPMYYPVILSKCNECVIDSSMLNSFVKFLDKEINKGVFGWQQQWILLSDCNRGIVNSSSASHKVAVI